MANEHTNIVSFPEITRKSDDPVDKSAEQLSVADILQLPSVLVNYRNKNYFGAFMLLVIGGVLSFCVKDWKPMVLFTFFMAYFVWRGLSIANDYRKGRIVEIVATCTGIKPSAYMDRITVTFAAASEDDTLVYYKFVVPTKKAEEDFIVGAVYVIYFDLAMQHSLMGHVQVAAAQES